MHQYTLFAQVQRTPGSLLVPISIAIQLDHLLKDGVESSKILNEVTAYENYHGIILTGIYYYGKTYKKKA